MLNTLRWPAAILLFAPFTAHLTAQVLWREPPVSTVSDWTWGPGGEAMSPRAPFEFVKERLGGTNPKVEVRDAAGRHWVVKFGSEVHADTFAPRLLNALGYAAEPAYFVRTGSITGVHDLKRAKHFVGEDGSFERARFKLREHHAKAEEETASWSWAENPFVGSHELGGIKIVMMLLSNWDSKDARDGEGSNNGMIRPPETGSSYFAVTDWGASLGKSGGFFRRTRWDWNGYIAQSTDFVRTTKDGTPDWGYQGKRGRDITAGVRVEDVLWLNRYLARITDEELNAGLVASGASPAVARVYAQAIRQRITQLQRIAPPKNQEQASK